MMAVQGRESWLRWSSADFSPRQQFDAWHAALNESHLKWNRKTVCSGFRRGDSNANLGGIRLLHCQSDPCHGKRTPSEIRQSDEAYFGLLLIYEGCELVRCCEKELKMDKSGLLLWDSTRPIDFEVGAGLKKVTMLVPQDQLRSRFPLVDHFVGEKINVSSGLGAVTASHIGALGREACQIENGRGNSIADLTLELVSACLEAKQPRPMTKARLDLLAEIKDYIENNLDDIELGPGTIASRFCISIRYLHLLFEDVGVSVSNWIIQRRLEKCRRELVRSGPVKSNITEIAFKWGFNDSAHFSRAFHKYFGLSPREYQKRHFN